MKKILIFLLIVFLAFASLAGVYKWTDEAGDTHYSDRPPKDSIPSQEVKIQPSVTDTQQKTRPSEPLPPKRRSLPLQELGPLPDNSVSKYLYTKSSGVTIFDVEKKLAKFSITLSATSWLPHRAYLVVYFENPENPEAPVVEEVERQFEQAEFFILSTEVKSPKCWNYLVLVKIYRDKSKQELLGEHRQYIQSRVNLDRVNTLFELIEAAGQGGRCP